MRKILEIDSPASYEQTGYLPLTNTWSRRKSRVNPLWFQSHFTLPQQKFLETHGYAIRSHPRHNPTIELFINEQNLTERDWTIIRLMF